MELVSSQPTQTAPDGADVLALLDSCVETIHADGSRAGVMTQVLFAVNERGRDGITAMSVGPRHHRQSILQAFSIHPDGTRYEATRPRDGKVRFPSLTQGSVLVFQVRYDAPAQPYLGGYVSNRWFFHMSGLAAVDSHYTLWTDASQVVHADIKGPATYDHQVRGQRHRHRWAMTNVAPLIPEPAAPPVVEIAHMLTVSTVPDWDAFMQWERALLSEAFRASPEVTEVAQRLTANITSTQARFAELYRFVVEEIRYQQDYENTIAGVKPHTAPVVLERRYGDCKDKSVLLMVLARAVGIEAHFALVRTRRKGPVLRDVPHQQFNHAVVYVPEQGGVEEGFFVDPTADGFDLDVLRPDVPGTVALTYDPESDRHAWREVPFQPEDAHQMVMTMALKVSADGSARGTLSARGKGGQAAQLRKLSRNPAQAEKALRALVGKLMPAARVDAVRYPSVNALDEPVHVEVDITLEQAFEFAGRVGTLTPPWRNLGTFAQRVSLESRQMPLVVGVPQVSGWVIELTLPRSWRALTESGKVEAQSECSSLSRETTGRSGRIVMRQMLRSRCERITPEQYEDERRFSLQADTIRDGPIRVRR